MIGLDDELSALREDVARLRAENARLLRLLELTPRQARPPGPVQTGVFDGQPGPVFQRMYQLYQEFKHKVMRTGVRQHGEALST